MLRKLMLVISMITVSGCATTAAKEPDWEKQFKVDNALMEQNKLLMYEAFYRFVAVEGVVSRIEVLHGKGVLYQLSDTSDSRTLVWVVNFGFDHTPSFRIGETVRVLGEPNQRAKLEIHEPFLLDNYLIVGICMANLADGKVAYIRQYRAECDYWERGRLDKIRRLTNRLKQTP